MITIRRSDERGHTDAGWLDSHHTFSFGEYVDPAHESFGALRVINEDRVEAAQGFGTHGHRDMEILSYVLDGALAHNDSMGTGSIIRPGELQRMSAGTGVRHSERNPSATEGVHFLQIWILPEQRGIAPEYEQKAFAVEDRTNQLRLIGSRDGRQGSITVHQDLALYATLLDGGKAVELPLAKGRRAWVQVASGSVTVNGQALAAGDGAALTDEKLVRIEGTAGGTAGGAAGGEGPAEVLVFDLA